MLPLPLFGAESARQRLFQRQQLFEYHSHIFKHIQPCPIPVLGMFLEVRAPHWCQWLAGCLSARLSRCPLWQFSWDSRLLLRAMMELTRSHVIDGKSLILAENITGPAKPCMGPGSTKIHLSAIQSKHQSLGPQVAVIRPRHFAFFAIPLAQLRLELQ